MTRGGSFINLAKVWWFARIIGLPISVPLVVLRLIAKMSENRRKAGLQGQVVMITGASSGLGESLAHSFYSQGCRVVLAARRVDELNRVKSDLLCTHPTVPTHPPVIMPLDLTEINELPNCIDKVIGIFGHIDILINNGGVSHRGIALETKVDVDIKIMLVNHFGPVALTKAVLPKMVERKSGHIVFISSVQGRMAIPGRSAYGAAKHAMQAFADSLRAEVHQYNINVSVVSPGYIKTAMSLNALTGSGDKHGIMDPTTAAGYEPSYVADEILKMVVSKNNELLICPFSHKLGIFLRYFWPSLFFWAMTKRARNLSKKIW